MKLTIYITLLLSLAVSSICRATSTCENENNITCNSPLIKATYTLNNHTWCTCINKDEQIRTFTDEKGIEHMIVIPADSNCVEGWATLKGDSSIPYHMLDPNMCHEENTMRFMGSDDYSDICEPIIITQDNEYESSDYDTCPSVVQKVNQEFLSNDKNNVNRACKVENEKDFNKVLQLATGTFTYKNKDLYDYGEDGIFVESCYENELEKCSIDWCPDYCADNAECGEDDDGCFEGCIESCGENVCPDKVAEDGSCHGMLFYSAQAAYWAFEHTCTVGVDEFDNKSNPIAKYRFNKKGEIERQTYDKKKKEWGAQSVTAAKWVKDGWAKDSTGWCVDPKAHCVINKQILVEDGVTLKQPIAIDKQEQRTWPFRIEIKYTGTDKPKFPGISYNNDEVLHQFIISGFNLNGLDLYGEMLPIYPDISGLKTFKNIKELTGDVLNNGTSPISVISPFFDSKETGKGQYEFADKVIGNLYEASAENCAKYGLTSCYIADFFYEETTADIGKNQCGQDVFVPGSVVIYVPDWVGIYLDNKFQFAGCAANLGRTVFDCDEKVILETDQEFKYGEEITYYTACENGKPSAKVEKHTVKTGFVSWHSKVIIPAEKIGNDKKYQFLFNWFGYTQQFGYDGGPTKENIIYFVRQDVKSPLACKEGEAKFQGTCIKTTECSAKNGFLTNVMGHDVCNKCTANETLVNNSCANKKALNDCIAQNRVWDDAKNECGTCKAGLKDINDTCVDIATEKAKCESNKAANGKWSYDSSNNSCDFKCNSGYKSTAGIEGVCQINCAEKGMIPNSDQTACACDEANHWVNYAGGGCKCADGYENPDGDAICTPSGPGEQDKCSSDSDCDDDEACKDGECAGVDDPEPLGGGCESNSDCDIGMLCSSEGKCNCDFDGGWVYESNTGKCEYREDEDDAIETICTINGGTYISKEGYCEYNKSIAACKVSGKIWNEEEGTCSTGGGTLAKKSGDCTLVPGTRTTGSTATALAYLALLGSIITVRVRKGM